MIKFYFNTAPNPVKVALLLEELQLDYEPIFINGRLGEQHAPGYLAVNPNAKVPSIVDGDVTVFDSNAILLYLAEKAGRFLTPPNDLAARGELLSWLMFVASGIGPYSGQAVHFRHATPEPQPYSLNRYDFEAERHWNIIEARLGKHRYMAGSAYTIVDMATWGWARMVPYVLGDEAVWAKLPNIKRLLDEVTERPAAQRVLALLEASKGKNTPMDEQARLAMFPHLKREAVGRS